MGAHDADGAAVGAPLVGAPERAATRAAPTSDRTDRADHTVVRWLRRAARLDPEFIRDLFAQFRPVTMKRMFGGAGLYSEGLMFGLVFDGAIYLKVDETNIPDFEREESRPFVYTRAKSPGRVGRHSLPYWRLPERLYDNPDDLAVWAKRALAIAERKKFVPHVPTKRKRPARSK